MVNKAVHLCTISELSKLLSSKKISSVELTNIFLQRIKKFDTKINSFITVCAEDALQAAQAADKLLASKNNNSPLCGIPIAHKDIFCTDGIKTSCASKMLDNFIAPYDATVVTRLKQSGAIMLGKTNMDEFAMGSSNENSYYGSCKNPWDLDYVPGGSSGGSAAAVAARLIPACTGTDTGGSIRQPAAFCGLTGLKPTYGRVSRYGMIAFASSLDQAGPIAVTARDCAYLLQEIAGFDHSDSTSSQKAVPDYISLIDQNLAEKKKFKIGIPKEFLENLSQDTLHNLEEAKKVFISLGAEFKTISLPNLKLSVPAYYVIAPAEASSNLARYDGVRYGYRCSNPKNLNDLYKRTRCEGFGLEVKRRIFIGTYVLSASCFDSYYLQAQKVRKLIANDFKQAFQEVDFIFGPTTPAPAFKLGANIKDPITMYLQDIYTAVVNLAGLPGLSLPSGFIQKMPVGIQLIGNYFNEAGLLQLGAKYQTETNWHEKYPEEFKEVV